MRWRRKQAMAPSTTRRSGPLWAWPLRQWLLRQMIERQVTLPCPWRLA